MIYSVYNYTTRTYDYYEGSGPKGAHAGKPPLTLVRSALGATPEQAAWKVPADAKKVGEGQMPKGRVATLGGLSGMTEDSVSSLLVVGALGYLAWRILR